ncbi:hypothetical protein CHU92_04310 [Flavobacterium cyanobacteriorum]|uniref:VCBS repeat-containing protein n=1 Tax=Flavobacterium cyanobacteriorum TaxID=2022802 RepID=A0A255ZL41_9FLAO|nr:hypothetical protein [Flavobacterium cyanobacteriorum]OYQ41585.1 hypothetical protein CHU92_04310 [Flavobacterium cyanobacteriorum]
MKYLLFIIGITVYSCNTKPATAEKPGNKFITPKMLSIAGDFDGDGKCDSLKQFLAGRNGTQVTKLPAFEKEAWEEIVKYYSEQSYYTVVVINDKAVKPLTFDNAQGLYCLINVGDLNGDKRDEIAIVPDLLDFSRHNHCHIYSLCVTGWKSLFSFNIHEGAFDYIGNTEPIFNEIPEALELRGKKWHFYDYLDMEYKTPEEVGQMKELIVPLCH